MFFDVINFSLPIELLLLKVFYSNSYFILPYWISHLGILDVSHFLSGRSTTFKSTVADFLKTWKRTRWHRSWNILQKRYIILVDRVGQIYFFGNVHPKVNYLNIYLVFGSKSNFPLGICLSNKGKMVVKLFCGDKLSSYSGEI